MIYGITLWCIHEECLNRVLPIKPIKPLNFTFLLENVALVLVKYFKCFPWGPGFPESIPARPHQACRLKVALPKPCSPQGQIKAKLVSGSAATIKTLTSNCTHVSFAVETPGGNNGIDLPPCKVFLMTNNSLVLMVHNCMSYLSL